MKKTTIKDVAKLADVSISSVSRYMSEKTSINEYAAVRIAKAIEELNYIPNTFARNLKNGATNIVGFIQPDISQDLFNQCMKAMNEMLFQNDYLLITCDTGNKPEKERTLINSLLQQNVAAIVVVTSGANTSFLQEISAKTDKLIIANRPEPTVEADTIYEDQIMSGYRLASYMIAKGFKKFGVLFGVPYSAASKNRLLGFRKAFRENNIELPESAVFGNCIDYESTRTSVIELIQNNPEVNCILFTNQRSGAGVMQGIQDLGLEINKDIFTAGFTSKHKLSQSKVKFPCIMEDTESIGMLLGEFVMKKVKKPIKSPRRVIFEVPLVDLDNGIEGKLTHTSL